MTYIYTFGFVIIVVEQEVALWPKLNPFQIMCKETTQNELPDMSLLSLQMQNVCKLCLLPMRERPSIDDVLKSLLDF